MAKVCTFPHTSCLILVRRRGIRAGFARVTRVRALTCFSGAAFLAYGVFCVASLSMVNEFNRIGLSWLRFPTGALEILGGAGLLIGLKWNPALTLSSAGLAAMMFIAFGVRLWMWDGIATSFPSLVFAIVNSFILLQPQTFCFSCRIWSD
jgi:uncharacterized membrane protein YphA (DoxX/SURF4 family)